jgi:hypothetical protein
MSTLPKKAFIGLLLLFLAMAALLFVPAGTLDYWQAWTFLAAYFAWSLAITLYLMKLGDSRILFLDCKKISFEYCSEMVPTVSHCLGSRWFVVAIPAAETCRDPSDKGE